MALLRLRQFESIVESNPRRSCRAERQRAGASKDQFSRLKYLARNLGARQLLLPDESR